MISASSWRNSGSEERKPGRYRGHCGRIPAANAFCMVPLGCDRSMRSDCSIPCRTGLCTGSTAAAGMRVLRSNPGVSFLSGPRESGIITSEGRSWIQSSSRRGPTRHRLARAGCNAFDN
ncbi:hypothetical protein BTHE_1923 [Bifidobacterium thermophilum]|nr:hypothetical protein BTHE_1923 [Bifidobacterium thermophilum]